MPTLSRIAIHPIKALDPVAVERVSVTDVGGLEGDRTYAIVDENGDYVNGKRTAAVHRLRSAVDLETNRVSLRVGGDGSAHVFDLDRDRAALEAWLSEYFGLPVALTVATGGPQTDSVVFGDGTQPGPTLISEATLTEVSSWYPGIDAAEMRLRLRPNLVVEGVPAFWEDRVVADGGRPFRIGDVPLVGVESVPRCVVPTRDPRTGEDYEGFQETFVEQREETLPEWADREAFDDRYFQLMALTRIPVAEGALELAVGDEVRLTDDAVDG